MNLSQITIVCLIKAKKTKKEVVFNELKKLAILTRKEEGNLNYDIHISNDDNSLFVIYENWKDQESLDMHMSQKYLKEFISKESELLEYPIDGKICKIIK